MEARYNIYFSGQLLEGHELAEVRVKMAKLFSANEATLDKLFSGNNQLVKRDCDKATALKYKQAIERCGGVPVIKIAAQEKAPEAQPEQKKTMTAAEKIAALAGAPDLGSQRQATATEPAAEPVKQAPAEQAPGGIQLAPEGTAVLQPGERQAPAVSTVSTPKLELDPSGQRLSEVPPPASAAPDTSHLSEGPVGELLPNLPSSIEPLSPDTSAIELTPDGTDLSDCAALAEAAPELDLSDIELAPAGADVLEEQFRKKHDTPAPDTDHLAVEEQPPANVS